MNRDWRHRLQTPRPLHHKGHQDAGNVDTRSDHLRPRFAIARLRAAKDVLEAGSREAGVVHLFTQGLKRSPKEMKRAAGARHLILEVQFRENLILLW